ncbi:hypothetical protein BDF20DRAFT_830116 [Mycotypha africana]|uniref:uncharacterized protein n=1 Tax=Mycotypha africana TaxID=64632 RepID=UPI0023008EB7|nr:uncharacterized protein BDF20DRAFT_830116 [Mycotypha africana]KAI8967061.1 hypothetical protein BDF20DRAFT_830116 [Mycotypha africana]
MSTERVFFVGGTGNIGAKAVNDLLENKVAVTLYARNPEKVDTLFKNYADSDLLKVVQGDYDDLTPLKDGIRGHTRLFLLIADFRNFPKTKETIAKYAYEAGVKQIVDISSFTVNMGWRQGMIGSNHYYGEKLIYDIPHRGYFVALRPGRFMSNLFNMIRPLTEGAYYSISPPDAPEGWVSPNDIGAVAAVILREDIHKHGDGVYMLTSDVMTANQVAETLSSLCGRDIPYKQITPVELYKKITSHGAPHLLAMDLVDGLATESLANVNACIEILTGRKPETLKEYLSNNKALLQ